MQVAFPNKDTQFKKGQSGNKAGRPKGAVNLSVMVRRILEGDEELPQAIAQTIKNAIGADKKALEATVIVVLLQAFHMNNIVEVGWDGKERRTRQQAFEGVEKRKSA